MKFRLSPSAVVAVVALISLLWGCSGPSSLDMAEAAYRAGNYDAAIAWSSRSIDRDSGPADAYLIRGKCYEKKGDPLRAIADYEVARVEAPDRGEPAFRQTKCYLAVGRPVDAEATISKALKERYKEYSLRDQMLAHAVHGEVQLAVGDYPSANDSFGTALKVAQTSRPLQAEGATSILHYNMSRAQFELGSYRRSREFFQAYLESQKRAGERPREQDLYTLAVLHFLCEDIAASRNVAGGLSAEYKQRVEDILSGETFSVSALYDLKVKQKQADSAADSNP
jgi:tetratricopeptide (TPR) repeat protein